MPWPLSNHESPDLQLRIPRVTAAHYLWAMLSAEGEEFRSPYKRVRDYLDEAVREFQDRTTGGQAPSSAVNDSRLRTWKRIFEQFGLLTVDEEQRIRATRLGRAVADGASTAQTAIDQANHHIAELGALVADRVLLAAPNSHGRLPVAVPPDADLRPLRAIWKAFRRQGNKLHWQDVNRVLGHVHFERDVDAAIDRITAFRAVHPSSYPTDVAILGTLGPALTDDVRQITPWFTRAGVGGMLIPPEMDSLGFRILDEAAVPIIDQLLAMPLAPVPENARSESAAYVAYLMAPVDRVETPAVPTSDAVQVQTVLDAVRRFGRHRFIVLSGLPGTGKTRLARMAAGQLTDGDKLRLKVVQFHKGTAYDDFIEGFVPRPDGQGFERRHKTLRLLNQRALDNPGKTHVLLIEELTRADVVAVLGELLTYIEHRDETFTFSLSQEESAISTDLVVLCTMNPRDRSAMSLDDAVSRRMHRIAVPPSSEGLVAMLRGRLPDEVLDRLDKWYREHLAVLPFGHGIFEGATDRDALRGIWEGTVVPLISDPLGRVVEAYRAAYDAFPLRGDVAEPAITAPEPAMPTVASPGGD